MPFLLINNDAEFLTSINLISATEAALFAQKMNDKLCQHTVEGSSGLKEYIFGRFSKSTG